MPNDAVTRAEQRMRGEGLTVTPFREMRQRKGCRYVIKNLIPGASFVLVYGLSGSGKTFFIGYAALCIAAERDFLGNKVRGGLVVYVSPENPLSVEERFHAFGVELGIEEATLFLVAGDLDMLSATAFSSLLQTLRMIAAEHGHIATVVVDTVSQAMPGADENGSDGMTAFVRACQKIRLEFDCAIVAVHHAGKDATRGARGHSSLRAAVDVEIEITEANGLRLAEVTKNRDGQQGLQIPFGLRSIKIGVDEDGDPITTCMVESTFAPSRSMAKPSGNNQKLMYQALQRCTSVVGRPLPGRPLSAIRAVALSTAREEAADEEFAHINPKHRSTRINDAISGLKASNIIGWEGDLVWINSPVVAPPAPLLHRGGGAGGAADTPENTLSGKFGAFRGGGNDG